MLSQMRLIQHCSFCPKIQHSSAFLLFLLILSSTHARFLPQGRSNFMLIDNDAQKDYKEEEAKVMERRSLLIGSRPPRCERHYCRNCGHCEAVQVPIVPRLIRTTEKAVGTSPRSIADSRSDDLSNYKPMCWKCKCGDFMFDP